MLLQDLGALVAHLRAPGPRGATAVGVHIGSTDVAALAGVDLRGVIFARCPMEPQVAGELARRGATVLPHLPGPLDAVPVRLYSPEDLAHDVVVDGGKASFDVAVAELVVECEREAGPDWAIHAALHDAIVDGLLAEMLRTTGPAVGVMGGHAVARGSEAYRRSVLLGRALAEAGVLPVTGGGPGVMEAVNLGAFLAGRPDRQVDEVVRRIAGIPAQDVGAVLALRAEFTPDEPVADPARRGGLAISSWRNDLPQPANMFAAANARYLAAEMPESKLMEITRCRVAFAAGRAGTVQEVFQTAAWLHYGTKGSIGPVVLLDSGFWTESMPVGPLLERLLASASTLFRPTDDIADAVAALASAHS